MSIQDRDQAPIDNIAGYIQCMSTAAIAAAARGEVDIIGLLRAELGARGMDTSGKWVGFKRAAEIAACGAGAIAATGVSG